MQRSSPSIGNLAAALAKAQPELVNPEKSLAATIRSEGAGAAELRPMIRPICAPPRAAIAGALVQKCVSP